MEERYTASNDRGSKKNSDNTKLRYVYTLVIVSVIMSVANILLDLRYNMVVMQDNEETFSDVHANFLVYISRYKWIKCTNTFQSDFTYMERLGFKKR